MKLRWAPKIITNLQKSIKQHLKNTPRTRSKRSEICDFWAPQNRLNGAETAARTPFSYSHQNTHKAANEPKNASFLEPWGPQNPAKWCTVTFRSLVWVPEESPWVPGEVCIINGPGGILKPRGPVVHLYRDIHI